MITPTETLVLALVAQGKPDKIIAHELGMAYGTVKKHTQHILQKLGVTNRWQAAIKWQALAN